MTVLFCDVVGSTDHRARLGEIEADRFFVATEQLLRDVVASRGGMVVKGGGDGIMATFTAASDATAAAIALHQQVASSSPEIQLRVGVAAGDVTWEGDDCFGMPVVIAARLESACEPGGILVSAIVRLLAGDRADADYEPVGPLDLKGVPGEIDAFSVSWARHIPEEGGWTFPSALPLRSERPFVGRGTEVAELTQAWSMAAAGGYGTVLLGGEAGVGKTRLAAELATRIHHDGALVLCGLCDDDLSLPYQPWVMAFDELIRQLPVDALENIRTELSQLQVLVPRIEGLLPGLPQPPRLDPEAERHRLLSAAATLLETATELTPVLLVLDDLHWGGNQTLDLLRFLVRTRPIPRSLIVATFRDTGDEVTGPLTSLLADFRRIDSVTRRKVGGIDSDAVFELLTAIDATGDLRARAETIADRTRGNAFLVSELSLHASVDAETVPDSVMDVVGGRLLRLGETARHVANVIAVAGRVELDVLIEASRTDAAALGQALGELVGAELIQELGGGRPAYQFAHALIRDAVMSSLPSFERFALHDALARSLERVHETDRRLVLPELARHFSAAAPMSGWDKAAYYGRRAAGQARRTAAYEEAIGLIQNALEVTPAGTEERALLLVDAVDLLERCGRNPEAVDLAEEADDVAAELGDVTLQAKASIELERAAHLANASLERSLPRLERVLQDGDALKPELSCRVTASLGRARWLTGTAGGPELIARGLEDARDLGEPAAISHGLEMACVAERDPRQALAFARELEEVTTDLGNIFQSMWAMTRQTDALLTLGRLAEAELVLDRLRTSADRYRFTSYQYLSLVFSHSLALAAAEFELAEAAAEAANTAEEAEFAGLDASGAYGLEMFMVRRAQGRLEEMRPVLQLLANNGGAGGVWQPGLVVAYAELGMVGDAAAGYEALVADGCASCARDTLWPLTLLFLSDTCVLLDRGDTAAMLLAELEPFGGLTIRAGYTTNGGPADRCRAALAELDGRHDEADDLIAAAHDLARSSASPLWLAATESTWAWICARRGDIEGVELHDAVALELADRHGIGSIAATALPTIRSSDADVEVGVDSGSVAGWGSRRVVGSRGGGARLSRARPQQPSDRGAAPHQSQHGGQPRAGDPAQDVVGQPHRGRHLRPPLRLRPPATTDDTRRQCAPAFRGCSSAHRLGHGRQVGRVGEIAVDLVHPPVLLPGDRDGTVLEGGEGDRRVRADDRLVDLDQIAGPQRIEAPGLVDRRAQYVDERRRPLRVLVPALELAVVHDRPGRHPAGRDVGWSEDVRQIGEAHGRAGSLVDQRPGGRAVVRGSRRDASRVRR